uniref:Ig-like domain-containing protein n=1 Tax=Podarcis muralis TaxID=64176 RepID=A0A670JBT8_PODMU
MLWQLVCVVSYHPRSSCRRVRRTKMKLSCKHPQISTETIFWYRQRSNEAPRSIVSGYKNSVSSKILDGAMIITSDRKANEFSFNRVTLEDSGMYYCALSDTVLHPTAAFVQ